MASTPRRTKPANAASEVSNQIARPPASLIAPALFSSVVGALLAAPSLYAATGIDLGTGCVAAPPDAIAGLAFSVNFTPRFRFSSIDFCTST